VLQVLVGGSYVIPIIASIDDQARYSVGGAVERRENF
jgi:hypothetical protein